MVMLAVPPNVHPHLTFRVIRVTFRDEVPGMLEQDGHLTKERKAEIVAQWTPRIGEAFPHTRQFPEGVDFRPIWSPYVAGEEHAWITNQCPECTHPFVPAIRNLRTS